MSRFILINLLLSICHNSIPYDKNYYTKGKKWFSTAWFTAFCKFVNFFRSTDIIEILHESSFQSPKNTAVKYWVRSVNVPFFYIDCMSIYAYYKRIQSMWKVEGKWITERTYCLELMPSFSWLIRILTLASLGRQTPDLRRLSCSIEKFYFSIQRTKKKITFTVKPHNKK